MFWALFKNTNGSIVVRQVELDFGLEREEFSTSRAVTKTQEEQAAKTEQAAIIDNFK